MRKRGFFSHLLRMLFTRDNKKHLLTDQMPLGSGYYRDKDGRKILFNPQSVALTKVAQHECERTEQADKVARAPNLKLWAKGCGVVVAVLIAAFVAYVAIGAYYAK
jgi:hypothetical protein